MQIQQPLTKENFWNRMMELYPNETKKFCLWIDEYKEAVNWKGLFNDGATGYKEGSAFKHKLDSPKFHDLPHAMQQGIWLEYVCQRGGCQFEIEDFFEYDLAEDIEGMFKNLFEDEGKDEFEYEASVRQ